MTPASNGSPIARAIAELETEKSNLAARSAKVDEAIAALRTLFHLPVARRRRRRNLERMGMGTARATTTCQRRSARRSRTVLYHQARWQQR
jgi:hypothetical protein